MLINYLAMLQTLVQDKKSVKYTLAIENNLGASNETHPLPTPLCSITEFENFDASPESESKSFVLFY